MWYYLYAFWVLHFIFYFFSPNIFPGLMVFSRLSEDVALPDFFHSLFSVCVCVYVDMSVYCPFKIQNAHSHTCTHMHTAKIDSACLSHSQPWLQGQMWRTFLFFWFLLCFIRVHWLSLWVSTRCRNTRVLFVSCHRLGLHTLPRGALVHEGRPKQTQIESIICAWLFHVFYLTFRQIAFHVRNIYCEGLLMCMSNYF